MTSGRCAATEALGCCVEELERRHPLGADPLTVAIIAEGRAALASPCCVSADQEQVKEALRMALEIVRGLYDYRMDSGDPVNVELLGFVDEFSAALALLGSQIEEGEQ